MRALRITLLTLLVLGTAGAIRAEHHELLEELEAIGDEVTRAMLEDDVEAMLSMYLPDAISMGNYMPRMDGVEAFRAHHEQMAASGMKIVSFESEPTEAWEVADHVIEIGTFAIQLDLPGMPGVEDHGKYMTVYVRGEDGSLKIKAEMWNSDVNPMEMGAHGHDVHE